MGSGFVITQSSSRGFIVSKYSTKIVHAIKRTMNANRKPQVNERRTAKMQRKSDHQLIDFVKAKTLSSAAAMHELVRRYDWSVVVNMVAE